LQNCIQRVSWLKKKELNPQRHLPSVAKDD
jgi:hypothetical protein